MARDLDLLGDPIPEGWGEPGRPEHIPTTKNRNKVMLLLALGRTVVEVAAAVNIDPKTLRKHYSAELGVRRRARAMLDGEMHYALAAKALEGDVPAYREMRRILDRIELGDEHKKLQGPAPHPAKPAPQPKLGKKEERQQAAEQVGGIFAPGPAPVRATSH